jgi:hypothetical protein
VANEPLLRRFIVVGGADEQAVHTDCVGGRAVFNDFLGVVAAGAGDDGNAPVDAFHDELNDAEPLVERERRALAGGCAANDCVRMICNLQFDQPCEAVKSTEPFLKRRLHRYGAATKDGHFYAPPIDE